MPATARAEMRLQPTMTAPALARHRLLSLCTDEVSDDTRDTAELLVSELVTNCVRHARTMITLVVERDRDRVAVAIGDDDDNEPTLRTALDVNATGGRGMQLVDQLAGDWGVRRRDGDAGKVVWFRLP